MSLQRNLGAHLNERLLFFIWFVVVSWVHTDGSEQDSEQLKGKTRHAISAVYWTASQMNVRIVNDSGLGALIDDFIVELVAGQ